MAKGQQKTRKAKKVLTIPQLRKAFNHMDKVVEDLRSVAKRSFSDAVAKYREEWRRTFKHDLSPADASSYLKFRYGMKNAKTRRTRMRGGAVSGAIAGAPLDYSLRPGVTGVYGNFPTQQLAGLDRYYAPAIASDCGKASGFPTDGSAASQAGGSLFDPLFRPLTSSNPPSMGYASMMTDPGKGLPLYASADPTGPGPIRSTTIMGLNPGSI